MKELSNLEMVELIFNSHDPKYVFSGIRHSLKSRFALLEKAWKGDIKNSKFPEEEKKEMEMLIGVLCGYKKEPRRIKELLLHVLATSTSGYFDRFISDPFQPSRIGASIALHNLKIRGCFQDNHHLNWENWLKFDGAAEKTAEIKNHLDEEMRWCRVQVSLQNLLKQFENSELFHCLRKDAATIEKQKNLFLSGQIQVGEDWRRRFFPKFRAGLYYLAEKKRALVLTDYQNTFFCAAHVVLKNAYQKAVTEKFKVRLWKRDPRIDLFQGNHSDCCIAIGGRPAVHPPGVIYKTYPAGIFEYLIDFGIQVAQVENSKGGIIGQCWLFVGINEENIPFLIADSFDLNERYRGLSTGHQRKINQAIRSCMFDFLEQYAGAVGLKKIYLGNLGSALENGDIYSIGNAVETDDLSGKLLKKPIEKLGGYWLNQPYFLESVGGTEVFVIKE